MLDGRLPLPGTITYCDCDFCLVPEGKRLVFSREGSQQRLKYSDDYYRIGRRKASGALVTAYYATAATALCASLARVLEFDRFLHTAPPTLV